MTKEFLNEFIDTVKLKYYDYIVYVQMVDHELELFIIQDEIFIEIGIETLHKYKPTSFLKEEDKIIADVQQILKRFKRDYILSNL